MAWQSALLLRERPLQRMAEYHVLMPDLPENYLYFGKPAGAAMPLMWAHAEYVKLLRSANDGKVFDLIPAVAKRYLQQRNNAALEVWKHNRRTSAVQAGKTLRIQAPAPFTLHWSQDRWHTVQDTPAQGTALNIHFVDIAISQAQTDPLVFTFYWNEEARWEGRDYAVAVQACD
jgi:glucoamylase